MVPTVSVGGDPGSWPGKRVPMSTVRRLALIVSAALLAVVAVATTGTGRLGRGLLAPTPGRRPARPSPRRTPPDRAAAWLASQLTPQGYYPTAPRSGTADLSATANTVLALSAANVDPAGARAAFAYLAAHVDTYVTDDGADGPAQLALLILDAVALGTSPHDFGGTDLVARLLATQQTTGPDAGLFGTENQVTEYAAGGYQQGLALAALAAAGVRGTPATQAGVAWLVAEQCPDGGWTSPDNAGNACSGTPADYAGPDTNSTALAVRGAGRPGRPDRPGERRRPSPSSPPARTPTAAGRTTRTPPPRPGVTDPDSTALVIQGLLALGAVADRRAVHPRRRGTRSRPCWASAAHRRAPAPGPSTSIPRRSAPDTLATYQAVPALAGV